MIFIFYSVGCKKGVTQVRDSAADGPLVKLWESEVQLKENYDLVEEEFKQNHGLHDQDKVDLAMQILIDDGHLPVPFIVRRDSAGLTMEYLSYAAYKDYRARIPIDTTSIMIIYFDSLGNQVEKP